MSDEGITLSIGADAGLQESSAHETPTLNIACMVK